MYDIEDIIKHRKPMRLVDKLISFDEDKACVSVAINENCEFYQAEKKGVPSYIGIEYMAQAIAAHAGAKELENGNDIRLGFLLGSRKYKPSTAYFTNGVTLLVYVEKLLVDAAGLSVFDCEIVAKSQPEIVLAKAKVNVYQPEDSTEYVGK